MHIFFSGIGGSGMSSLALLAKQAGYTVSGSDSHDSAYIEYLKKYGVNDIYIGQSQEQIAKLHSTRPIDWLIYSPAIPMTNPNHPELVFAEEIGIKASREDDFISFIISEHNLKLIAIAGTHGKSTTTAMTIWLLKQVDLPISYSFGGKLDFGLSGEFDKDSKYFVLEADEFDRKFLSFYPQLCLISGLDWDHPDIYPTRESYDDAFREFIGQTKKTYIWHDDAEQLDLANESHVVVLDRANPEIDNSKLRGQVNRQNAWLVANSLADTVVKPPQQLFKMLDDFPGLSRRFEMVSDNIYTDYAHTPPKIRGALQLAHEVSGDDVVAVYEGLHNLRQHFIKNDLATLFDDIQKLYVVPSYLARENPNQEVLTPGKIVDLLSSRSREHAETAELDQRLIENIKQHAKNGKLVLCLSAGGAGSLDEWLRQQF